MESDCCIGGFYAFIGGLDTGLVWQGLCVDARGSQEVGLPAPRVRPQGFEALLSIIVSQQVSTEAARAIMGRVENLLLMLNPCFR